MCLFIQILHTHKMQIKVAFSGLASTSNTTQRHIGGVENIILPLLCMKMKMQAGAKPAEEINKVQRKYY